MFRDTSLEQWEELKQRFWNEYVYPKYEEVYFEMFPDERGLKDDPNRLTPNYLDMTYMSTNKVRVAGETVSVDALTRKIENMGFREDFRGLRLIVEPKDYIGPWKAEQFNVVASNFDCQTIHEVRADARPFAGYLRSRSRMIHLEILSEDSLRLEENAVPLTELERVLDEAGVFHRYKGIRLLVPVSMPLDNPTVKAVTLIARKHRLSLSFSRAEADEKKIDPTRE